MKKQNLTFMYNYYISALYIQCTIAPVPVYFVCSSTVTSKAAPAPAPVPHCVITVEEECEERTEVTCTVLYCTLL